MTGASADEPAQAPVVAAQSHAEPPSFQTWIEGVRTEALARGISQRTVDEALASVEHLDIVVQRDRTQAEMTLNLDRYLKRRLTSRLVKTARKAYAEQKPLLARVERQFGVPGPVVVAIWGLESHFGRFTGIRPTVAALATLSFEGRRTEMFREELFAALKILDQGDVTLAQLRGSWAGTLGQPQFMPSVYLTDAVDFDADGRRDIWSSAPDVLASIANYLKTRGWVAGQRWGREVTMSDRVASRVASEVPLRFAGACRAVREMSEARPLRTWASLGVRLKSGGPLPKDDMNASLIRVDRRTFLIYANYEALLAYNCANTYALSVALLADRIG